MSRLAKDGVGTETTRRAAPSPSDWGSAPPWRSRFAWRHPVAYLGVHTVLGLALSVACIWFFFAIADEVPEKGAMVRLDLFVAAWLQQHGTETGESIFSGVSWFGAQLIVAVLVLAGLVLLWRRDWRHLATLVVTCGGGALLNLVLKLTFHRTRPVFATEFESSRSWSFPSGHAMDSFIVYGLFAYWIGVRFPRARLPAAAIAAAVVGVIGFSRLYLGVHYFSDVVAGFFAGCVWLVACISGFRFAERRRVGPGGADEPSRG